jgi:hypothetical protein
MFIAVYKCSRCNKMHYDKSNMRRHLRSACRDATLEKLSGVVVVGITSTTATTTNPTMPTDGTQSTPPRAKPGPKRINVASAWQGRIPAFEGGDDERIDAAFALGVVDTVLDAAADDIPVLLWDALWSTRAPESLQSLIMYRNAIHEIETLDEETGAITYVPRGTVTKRFVRDMAVYILELAYAIAKDSIPSRCPEKIPRATALLERLREDSLRDLLKDPKNKNARVTRVLAMLRDAMMVRMPSCFSR